MLHYLRLLLQLILAPRNGWEDIENDFPDARHLFMNGFIPLTIVMALSVFIAKIYHSDITFIVLLEKSIIAFVAFFAGFYIADFFFSLFLIRDIPTAVDQKRVAVYLSFVFCVMALMSTVINCVPFSPVLVLLPLYSIVVMRRGADFLGVLPSRIGHFMMLSIFSIFVPPYLIIFLFSFIVR